jgi:hypothetical protein
MIIIICSTGRRVTEGNGAWALEQALAPRATAEAPRVANGE